MGADCFLKGEKKNDFCSYLSIQEERGFELHVILWCKVRTQTTYVLERDTIPVYYNDLTGNTYSPGFLRPSINIDLDFSVWLPDCPSTSSLLASLTLLLLMDTFFTQKIFMIVFFLQCFTTFFLQCFTTFKFSNEPPHPPSTFFQTYKFSPNPNPLPLTPRP